jgi:hypothetical protein
MRSILVTVSVLALIRVNYALIVLSAALGGDGRDQRLMSTRRSRRVQSPLGDLFAIFPDLDWPVVARTPRSAVMRRLQNARAKARQARSKAEAIIDRQRIASERRRGSWPQSSRRK